MKTALITGITGQDGAYLSKFLLDKGYKVYGTYRRVSTPNFWRLHYLDVFDKINLISADLIDYGSIVEAVKLSDPDEVYNLASQSFVATSFEQPITTGAVTGLGVTGVLEAVRRADSGIKFYQASTSELYGKGYTKSMNEDTIFQPSSPYAAAKLYGYWMTKIYRTGYDLFATNGILFNHESPLRGLEFVTRKITNAVGKIAIGVEKEIRLGNLDAKRDWGYAPEYVKSMWLMLQQSEPDDFVIASNEAHSVREFVEAAFDYAGLDWQDYVKSDKNLFRPVDINFLRGNTTKAKQKLGWAPKIKFKKLVEIMTKEDMQRWERWQNGEHFPWDAFNYSSETCSLTTKAKSKSRGVA